MITLPTNRDENWRYANLRPLARAKPQPVVKAAAHDALARPSTLSGYEHWVFVDGTWSPELSVVARTPTQLIDRRDVHNVGDAFQTLLDLELETAGVDFALARANLDQGESVLMVYTRPGEPALDVEVTFIATQGAAQGTSYPRIQVQTAPNSRLNLVERHVSIGNADSAINGAIDVAVAAHARVSHVRVQDLATTASCFDTLLVNVAQGGSYQLRTVNLGAASSRSTAFIKLAGREARCEFTAASIAGGSQNHDTFVEIEHLGPGSTTRELFRGIANDRGKLAFNGKIIVRDSAMDADSDQSLKTLLNGSGAEAAARPQLEIYTDRVRAKHGATTGKLDEQMLFYMLSRGLDRADAQALLQWAFIEDAISRIELPALRREIETLVSSRLQAVASLSGLLGDRG